jgi:hypothetical protein
VHCVNLRGSVHTRETVSTAVVVTVALAPTAAVSKRGVIHINYYNSTARSDVLSITYGERSSDRKSGGIAIRDFASRCADRPKIPAVFASRRRDPASRRRRATTRCRVGVVGPNLSPDPVPGAISTTRYRMRNREQQARRAQPPCPPRRDLPDYM